MNGETLPDAPGRARGFVALFLANAWMVVLLWWTGSGAHWSGSLADRLNDIGRLTGLVGTYLVLVQLLLRTHVPWLVEAFGNDALRWAHTRNGYVALGLLVAHGILQTVGYALDDRLDVLAEIGNLNAHYEGVFLSIVSIVALVVLTALSVDAVRHRIPWPTWRTVHLYTYVAVALSVPHQLATGSDFVGAPLAVAYWWSLYVLVVGAIAVTRLPPLWRAARERPRSIAPALAATVLGAYLLLSVKVLPTQGETVLPLTPATAAPAAGPAAPSAAAAATPSQAASASASGVFVGDAFSTPYGDAQVQIVVSGGRLEDVEPLQLPGIRRVSATMSASVEPYLERRAIAAQSSRFDVISGATYTSRAYIASLETALRGAGLEK